MTPAPKVKHSEEEWRARLTPEQFRVTREHGTERAFSHPLQRRKARRRLSLAPPAARRCSLDDTKYDSGSGWPSFFQPIERRRRRNRRRSSMFMRRIEVRCAHLRRPSRPRLPRRPRPTGQRYCMNGRRCRLDSRDRPSRSSAPSRSGDHRRPSRSSRPSPRSRQHAATHHGITRQDPYHWLRADNWQEVMQNPRRWRPISAPISRPRTPISRRRSASRPADCRTRSTGRSAAASKKTIQRVPSPRRRLGLQFAHGRGRAVSAPRAHPARGRRRDGPARLQRRSRRRLFRLWRRRALAPPHAARLGAPTARARNTTRLHIRDLATGKDTGEVDPKRPAARVWANDTQRRSTTPNSTTTTAPSASAATSSARRRPMTRSSTRKRIPAFFVGVGETLSRKLHRHRRARPPDLRSLADRRRRPAARRASSRRASPTANTTSRSATACSTSAPMPTAPRTSRSSPRRSHTPDCRELDRPRAAPRRAC